MLFADPVFKTSVLAIAEKPLNAVLSLDPVTVERLSALAGTVVELRCLEPEVNCFVRLEDNHIRLAGYNEGPIDAVISGSVASLALLARSRQSLFSDIEGVSVIGQTEVIEQLQNLHSEMDLDWERFIVQIVGEIPGHFIAQGGRFLNRQWREGCRMVEANMADYLQEELKLIPDRSKIDHFSEQVSQLQASINSMSEQINRNFPSESDSSEA